MHRACVCRGGERDPEQVEAGTGEQTNTKTAYAESVTLLFF